LSKLRVFDFRPAGGKILATAHQKRRLPAAVAASRSLQVGENNLKTSVFVCRKKANGFAGVGGFTEAACFWQGLRPRQSVEKYRGGLRLWADAAAKSRRYHEKCIKLEI
jgi:hypothetical protein